MYAVIEAGGKQYRVEAGTRLRIEKVEAEVGSVLEFKPVLLKKENGELEFSSGRVVAEVISHGRGKKITVFKYRPKKNYKRWKGHRQPYTEILIKEVSP